MHSEKIKASTTHSKGTAIITDSEDDQVQCYTYESAAEGADEWELCEEYWDKGTGILSAHVTQWTCTYSSNY